MSRAVGREIRAPIGLRTFAFGLDLLFMVLVALVGILLLRIWHIRESPYMFLFRIILLYFDWKKLHVIGKFLVVCVAFAPGALSVFLYGRTPGKYFTGLSVVEEKTGARPTIETSIVREMFGKPLSGFLFGAGYVMALLREDQQSGHDVLAGTIVVQDRFTGQFTQSLSREMSRGQQSRGGGSRVKKSIRS